MSAESEAIRKARAGASWSGGTSRRVVVRTTVLTAETLLAASGIGTEAAHDAELAEGLDHPVKDAHRIAGLDTSRLADMDAETMHKDLESLAEIDFEKRKESAPTSDPTVPERTE